MSTVRILANESSDLANGRKTTAATTLRLMGFKDMGNENLSACAVPTLAEALALGWSVIPCGSDKRPLVSSWKPFQQRQATPHELEVWLARKPSAWAIVTGKISKRITLDFDGESGRHTLAKLGLRPHRSTPSGGFHVDFDHPGWHVSTLNSKTKRELGEKWPALDIRADGGYVIFNGKTGRGEYRWLRDPSSDSLEILPNELRKFLGLLHPPTEAPIIGDRVITLCEHRVCADLLIGRALNSAMTEGRNNAGFWLALQMRDNGYPYGEAESAMQNYASRCPASNLKGHTEPYRSQELCASVREAYSRPPRSPWGGIQASTSRPTSSEDATPDLLRHLHNDHGNANRLITLYGSELRYCPDFKKWMAWDTRRWAVDNTGQARRLAKMSMLEFLKQAVANNAADAEKFARNSLDARRIVNLLSMAESEIFVRSEELDVDPDLLNFRNGTVDLKTSKLHPHRRQDFITKLVHYDFRPEALCLRFQDFLDEAMGGGVDADETGRERARRLVEFLQRAIGYSLTGCTIEKAVFIPFGSGDNGKSTMLSTLRQLIEEYAVVLQVDTLMVRQESNNTQADLADLRGARFVQTSETEEGQRLAQGKLKRITQGMGTIKAVRKYENPIEFRETHKLWMDTNRKPTIRDADDAATFNRLHPIPFMVRIPKDRIDKSLPAKLIAEGEGILAWAVAGAKLWYQSGLNQPPEIKAAK